MFISREEKERRVIDLYSQGKTYRQIAEEVRISPNDIHAILNKKEEVLLLITRNNDKTSLPKPTNYFLKRSLQ
jgi:transposase